MPHRRQTVNDANIPQSFFYEASLKAPYAIAAIGIDSKFLWVNEAFCKLTGYAEVELTTLSWPDITFQEDIGSDLLEVNKVLKGETNHYTLTKKYIKKNGDLLDIELLVYRYPPEGDVLMFIAYVGSLMTTDVYIKKVIVELSEMKEKYNNCIKEFEDPNRLFKLIKNAVTANWGIITTVFSVVTAVVGWICSILMKEIFK